MKKQCRHFIVKLQQFMALLLLSSLTYAVPAVDQAQTASSGASGFGTSIERAQSFTVGTTGLLTQIDIQVTNVDSDIVLSIFGVTAGVPNEASLHAITVSQGSLNAWPALSGIDLTPYNIFVTAGDTLAFGLRKLDSPSTYAQVSITSSAEPYAGGTQFLRDLTGANAGFETWKKNPDTGGGSEYDFTFQTWVDPDGQNAPTANAGPDQSVNTNSVVTLNGENSQDHASASVASYAWVITSKPDGSTATLNDTTVVMPSFTADVVGSYTIALTVVDNNGSSSLPDSVTVTVADAPPPVAPPQTGNSSVFLLSLMLMGLWYRVRQTRQ